MSRKRNTVQLRESKFDSTDQMKIDGFIIESGDIIKIKGEYGGRFIFQSLVSNKETGVQWVDCIELDKGQPGPFRSFYPENVKRIPKRRKNVNRDRHNKTSG